MTGTAEQPAENTLAEDLAEALAEQTKDEAEEEVEEVEETSDSEDEEQEEEPKEETEEESDEAEESESDEPDEAEPEESLEAPQHWKAEDRELFTTLDRKGQEFLLRRHKEMEGDYTRKTQETAEARRLKDQLDEVLAPHRDGYQLQGMDDIAAIRQLFTIAGSLKTRPKETISWLAQQYGVDLTEQEEEQELPQFRALKQEIDNLKRFTQTTQQAQQQEQEQAALQQIEAFKSETDEKGQPKRPYFEQVKTNMGRLMSAGLASSLEDAYNQALKLDPQVQASIQEKTQEQRAEEEKRKKAAAAAKAKKAASGVKSNKSAGQKPVNKDKSLRDDILETMQELEAKH